MPKLTLSFKGRTLSVHRLDPGGTLAGRDPQCPLHIDSLAVAPRHLQIRRKGQAWRISALDPDSPVYLNGERVEEAELNHGDLIGLGKHTLTLEIDSRQMATQTSSVNQANADDPATSNVPSEAQPRTACLQILSGEHIGRIIPLNRSMVRVGKAGGDCAMIVHREGGHYLTYLEGATPTVNDLPIGDESIRLTPGSRIRIGDTELQFFC
jgi:predicted component of type VI protein secretion system